MTRLLHLSDLHFGAVDDWPAKALPSIAASLGADATVVSGDLTQRARAEQFLAARAFLNRLPGPVLAVPGNHDMPLFNLVRRLASPLAAYTRALGPDVEPALTLAEAVVQGVNSANPLVWKSGRLTEHSAARLTRTFAAAPEGVFRIAVMHHAPVPAADGTPADMAEPSRVLARLAGAGTDIVLSGHTHMPHAGAAAEAAGILFLQVGTAISTRRKTGANDFAVLDLQPGKVTLTPWIAAEGQDFAPTAPVTFLRSPVGWERLAG